MKQTKNYNLDLYEPNDLANLTDGYNNSMNTLDTSLKAVEDFVQTYDAAIEQNAADIVAEKDRATAAEKVNADAIAAETKRAQTVENELATGVSNAAQAVATEKDRATAAEKVNADAISAETKRAQTVENELATGVSNASQSVATEKNRATAAEKVNADAISSLNSKVDSLENGIVLLFGDSYGLGTHATSATSDGNGWMYYAEQLCGNAEVHKFANGGSSFTTNGTTGAMAGMNAKGMFEYAAAQIDNPNAVTNVAIQFGANENESSNIQTAATEALTRCKELFPNAKISLSFTYFGGRVNMFANKYANIVNAYKLAGANTGVAVNVFINLMYYYETCSYDSLHPTESINKYLGGLMANAAAFGSVPDVELNVGDQYTLSSDHVCTIHGASFNVGSSLPYEVSLGYKWQHQFGATRYFPGVFPSGDRVNWKTVWFELSGSGSVSVIGGDCLNSTVYNNPLSFNYI